MIKFPFILGYKSFERVGVDELEEIVKDYNDFIGANKVFVQNAVTAIRDNFGDVEESDDATLNRIEHNRQVALDHFTKLMANEDIKEGLWIGLRLDYDGLQEMLDKEFRKKIPITQSALNGVAPTIRAVASVLLIAEHIISALNKLEVSEKTELAIEFAKEGFNLLLDAVSKGNIEVPEYCKMKKELNKLKNMNQCVEFCEKLFFAHRS